MGFDIVGPLPRLRKGEIHSPYAPYREAVRAVLAEKTNNFKVTLQSIAPKAGVCDYITTKHNCGAKADGR